LHIFVSNYSQSSLHTIVPCRKISDNLLNLHPCRKIS
jgi:hypothetical protein